MVSATFNNREGLVRTLESLSRIVTKPKEVLVIDGGSTDGTEIIIDRYRNDLTIKFFSGRDAGVYDAMNKSRESVTTDLVHYLNAGDEVSGDPYREVFAPCRLPVEIVDPSSGRSWSDFIKLCGFGYCHQGVVFNSRHSPYAIEYRIAADFDLIIAEFPSGVGAVPLVQSGSVRYYLGGISTVESDLGRSEMVSIAKKRLGFPLFVRLWLELWTKSAVPRQMRRRLAGAFGLYTRIQKRSDA